MRRLDAIFYALYAVIMKYIHQLKVWPEFCWDSRKILPLLGSVRHLQGRLIGRMTSLGFSLRAEAMLETVTADIIKSSEIEGVTLNHDQVRSSIARQLGMDIAGLVQSDRNIDGVVEMMLDATQNAQNNLTSARLFGWHSSLFPTGHSGMHRIRTGAWRNDANGPMKVVSGAHGREQVHFEAPEADRLDIEMKMFLDWFNNEKNIDAVLKAGMAHFWFVTIHPFDDGNGRIARTIADMQMTRADGIDQRLYSMSAQICKERNSYYDILERSQHSQSVVRDGIDITLWLEWFLDCLNRAISATEGMLDKVFRKVRFWDKHSETSLNNRQKMMINLLLGDFKGKLTSSKWAKITKCSQDTSLRDISDLTDKGILARDQAGGRSTSYNLNC